MKRSKFTETQILKILQDLSSGTKISDLARKYGISEATIYGWRSRYGGMEITELQRLRELERENSLLRRAVSDLQLDITILKDINSKKW